MQEVTLTLPMLPDMELTASRTAGAMGEHIRMSPDKIDEVQMAVVEACINAFEHSGATDRKVDIHFLILGTDDDPQGMQITIRDAGAGFTAEDVAEARRPSEVKVLPRKRGHGLRIINGLMDEVNITSDTQGTVVVMRKMR